MTGTKSNVLEAVRIHGYISVEGIGEVEMGDGGRDGHDGKWGKR